MVLYAIENLDDALSATRRFLLPFEWGTWWRLALVTLLVAGGSGGGGSPANGAQYSFNGAAPPAGMPGDVTGVEQGMDAVTRFVEANLALIVGVVALLVLVGLLFAVVAAVMEFVLVESLRAEEVHVREYFRRYWRQGLRLFGFRLVLGLAFALAMGGLVALLVAPYALGFGAVSIVALLAVLPVLLALGVLFGLLFGFTTVFVVPIMLLEGRGVVSAWRRFWPTLRREWRQYAVYAVAGFILSIVAGFAAGLAVLVPALLVAVPFVIAFVLVTVFTTGALQAALAGTVVALFGLAVVALVAFVQVPIQTYLRYYALLVLGDTEPEFDVIPDLREAIRQEEENEGEGGGPAPAPA